MLMGNKNVSSETLESKADAQRRVNRIAGFTTELEELERAEVLVLSAEQKSAVADFHRTVSRLLGEQHDVDFSEGARRLSLGMQIVSFLGAAALAASVFFLFYQYWGYFTTITQVVILIAAPLLSLGVAVYLRPNEVGGYFAKLALLVSFVCFVLNIKMLGQIFNITPGHSALALWAVYAFLLAYTLNLRLLVGAGILCVFAFIGAETSTWSGAYWISASKYPENFLLPAIFLFFVPSVINHRRHHGFASLYQLLSMVGFFAVVLVLSNWGGGSYLDLDPDVIEGVYQVIGFSFSALAILLGMRKGWPQVMLAGNVFFALFLYTKFFDWWWDWLPKYLFFLLVGLTAILALFVFNRLRGSLQEEIAP
jgi:hypothetical protein